MGRLAAAALLAVAPAAAMGVSQAAHYSGAPTVKFNTPYALPRLVVAKDGTFYGLNAFQSIQRYVSDGAGGYTSSAAVTGLTAARGFTFDAAGTLYVTDQGTRSIHRYAADGSGGFTQQSDVNATPVLTWGVAVDANGVVYAADASGGGIHRYIPNGAGGYTQGSDFGAGVGSFGAMVIADDGSLYVTDRGNWAVHTFSPDGTGNYFQQTDLINGSLISDLTVDHNGVVTILNDWAASIQRWLPDGSGGFRLLTSTPYAAVGSPISIAADAAGDIYLSLSSTNVVALQGNGMDFGKVALGTTSPSQRLTFYFDTATSSITPRVLTSGVASQDFVDAGTGTCTTNGIAHSYSAGESCTVNVTFSPLAVGSRAGAVNLTGSAGTPLATAYLGGTGTAPLAAFTPPVSSTTPNVVSPAGMALDAAGNLYVANFAGRTVTRYPSDGSRGYGAGTVVLSGTDGVRGIAVDGTGALYTALDTGLRRYVPDGSGGYVLANTFPGAYGVTVNERGEIFFTYFSTLQRVTPDGAGGYFAPKTVITGLNNPHGVAFSPNGDLFVAEFDSNSVRHYGPDGTGGYTRLADVGSGLAGPVGVAVAPAGDLYIATLTNSKVYRYIPDGAGGYTQAGSMNTGNSPYGIIVDKNTNVLITNNGAGTVSTLKYSTAPSLTFATTNVGSSSAAQTVTLENRGNAALSFPIPSSGNNPSISPDFQLNSAGTSACPLTGSTSSVPGTLASGSFCELAISFAPTTGGAISGSLVLTDNDRNANPSTTQTIALSGTAIQPLTANTTISAANLTLQHASSLSPISAIGGTPPYTFTVSPALPAGLSLAPATGAISGTPTAISPLTTYTVTVTDAGSVSVTGTFSLSVDTIAASLAFPSPGTRTYGDAPFALSATSDSGGGLTYTVVSGPATIAGNLLTITGVGLVSLRVDQAADGSYAAASAVTSVTVQPAPLTVTADNAARSFGAANPAFSGAVTGAKNGDSITTSFATTASAASPVGSYAIVPSASGTALGNYAVTAVNGTLSVTKAASATALSVSNGSANPTQSITLSASVASSTSGAPTGTITFFDNGGALTSVPLSGGVATYAATFTAGSHQITASYGGDANFTASVSASASAVSVAPLDFTLSTPPLGALLRHDANSVSTTFQLAPTFGSYPGPVSLSLSGVPDGVTASVSPTTIAANAGAQTVTITFTRASAKSSAASFAAALLLLPVAFSRRRLRFGRGGRRLLLAVLAIAGAAATATLTGCGSGGNPEVRNYTVTLTAASGNVQHASAVTLTVQ